MQILIDLTIKTMGDMPTFHRTRFSNKIDKSKKLMTSYFSLKSAKSRDFIEERIKTASPATLRVLIQESCLNV